jgi:hypothetical protein
MLIGDVVGSRTSADRRALHSELSAALAAVNETCRPTSPLRITVGDEYQGRFGSIGEAIHAAITLRLTLAPTIDVRHGVGWGPSEVLQEEPRVEDGPGWWAARAAIEQVETAEQVRATRALRTAFRSADGTPGADPAAVNAALLAHDLLLDGAGERGMSVLRGMLAGMTQLEISGQLDITPSAVSQRVRGGLESVLAVEQLLAAVR